MLGMILHMILLTRIIKVRSFAPLHVHLRRDTEMAVRLSSTSSNDEDYVFLRQVETTVENVMQKYNGTDILNLPPSEREPLGVARQLQNRISALKRNNDCPRCWLQRAHCVCSKCQSLEVNNKQPISSINRLFLVMHHKEIGLAVDTAKLLLCAFPQTCRLVVGGIPAKYQASMHELQQTLVDRADQCLVLFPTDHSVTYPDLMEKIGEVPDGGWDLIVIDGTWVQARKLFSRYIAPQKSIRTVQLTDLDVEGLADGSKNEFHSGHQIRRHPVKWRQVSTLEATRLFLGDMMISNECLTSLSDYQQVGNLAARTQLGPPRTSQ